MPRSSKLTTRSRSIQNACSIASISVLEFLAPAIRDSTTHATQQSRRYSTRARKSIQQQDGSLEDIFFSAISRAGSCTTQRKHYTVQSRQEGLRQHRHKATYCPSTAVSVSSRNIDSLKYDRSTQDSTDHLNDHRRPPQVGTKATVDKHQGLFEQPKDDAAGFKPFYQEYQPVPKVHKSLPANFFSEHFETKFAPGSRLPLSFYNDVKGLLNLIPPQEDGKSAQDRNHDAVAMRRGGENHAEPSLIRYVTATIPSKVQTASTGLINKTQEGRSSVTTDLVEEQMQLLRSVRELEEKLAKARKELQQKVVEQSQASKQRHTTSSGEAGRSHVVLSKEDYINLVDLYYYSHNSRFSPESTDHSPTPSLLDDISFRISEDFSEGAVETGDLNEEEDYISPLKHVEEMLRQGKLREIAVMQVFVDLLLDDDSSNRALYEAYQNLPEPGVAYLPKGVIRVFLQRMSTPWTKSEKSMLRYLSLIDDMQKAKLPISKAEWSSAVYLAGRSFARVTESDATASFRIWQKMEQEAGVQASHVTFNILFDVAVRSGKFALGQSVLMEMSKRNLRLNRLGRVSMIYYHGLRGDGDGVRKTYRDFVEAGEIVDTLVLNCVIASLLNSQEPTAADQVYERMKSLHERLRKGRQDIDAEELFTRYPPPGEAQIDRDMASVHLGRILLRAKHLRDILPEHHKELQAIMPLTPDIKTFSSMIAYHATKSGDLDRISVLLDEMVNTFEIPMEPLIFQLLFKGFALHGPTGGPDSPWSAKRLDLCWTACRTAIKEGDAFFASQLNNQSSSRSMHNAETSSATSPTLPSITEINAIPATAPLPSFNPPLHNPPPRRLSSWNEFVLDLAAFPRQRLKRIERFHAQMFDEEDAKKPHEGRFPHTFETPFFQSTVYTAPEPALDREEGEYVLPSPVETTSTQTSSPPEIDSINTSIGRNGVSATRPLVCWLLRAYARTTKSRSKLEEIWGSVRKVWKPKDEMERESVIRVLRRCLKDCDREGNG